MKNRTLLAAASLGLLVLANSASAQSTWTNTASDNWLTGANWSTGVAPDATNDVAVFTNAITASWTNDTVTVGTISNLVGSGNVVVGNNAIATDVIELATTSGKPTIFVTNNGTIFMYANVTGTNGFNKTGGGTLAFRFNGDNMTYTGDILLGGGTLSLEKDGSLGNLSNNILVGATSTLLSAPGANSGTVTLTNTRGIVVSNGLTLNIQNNNSNTFTVINGNISGAGRVDFIGTSGGTNSGSSLNYTLGGTNAWTGQGTIQMGAKVTLSSGATWVTNLSISGGSGSWAGLDLGGNTQNVGLFAPASAATTARTIVISNGTLNVTNAGQTITWNGTNGTSLDMSGLTSFKYDGAPGGRNITIQPNMHTGAGFNTNYVYLATNGIGSNSLTAGAILVGGANGSPSAGNGNEARLLLGKINEIGATSFTIGGFNGSGVVAFAPGITDGSVKLTGSNGVARMGLLVVGETSSGTRRGFGTLDLGTANASVSNAYVGVFGANSVANLTLTNQITMAGGAFDTLNLYLGAVTNTTVVSSSITNISIFQQNGGTNTVGLLRMGDDRTTAASDTLAFQSSYNLVGANAVLKAQTIDSGTNAVFGANSSRALVMSNGATLQNASGVNLTVNGFDTTAGGRMNITLAGNGVVTADAGRTVTFGVNTRMAGSGNLVKTGTGTLVLAASNDYTGTLDISNGVVLASNNRSLSATTTGTIVRSGAALEFSNTVTNNMNNTRISGTGIATNGAIRSIGGSNQFNRGIVLDADARIQSDAGAYLTISNFTAGSNAVSGTGFNLTVAGDGNTRITGTGGTNVLMMGAGGSLTKVGNGTLFLTGSNNYTGTTTVSGGQLQVFAGATVGTNAFLSTNFVINGGALRFVSGGPTGSYITNTASLEISSGSFILDAFINQNLDKLTMSGGVLDRGSGIMTFTNATSSLTGGTILNRDGAAETRFNGDLTLGGAALVYSNSTNAAAGTPTVRAGGTITYSSTNTAAAWFTNAAAGAGRFQLSSASGTNVFDIGDAAGVGSEVNLDWATVGGTATLQKTGAGVLLLGQANGHSNTIINAGTIRAGNDASLGGGSLTIGNATISSSSSAGRTFGNAVVFAGNATFGDATGTGDLAFTNTASSDLGGATRMLTTAVNTTINAALGNGSLTKAGSATLTLAGSVANTYTGATTVTNGVLQLSKTAGTTAIAGDIGVGAGATLLISAANQVADASAVTLSGGTVSRASGVSEKFGDLTLSTGGTLDYGSGTAGVLEFGAWAPGSSVLTINNFFADNILRFSSDLSSFISGSTGTAFSNANFNISGMSAAGFSTDWNGSTFTITSVPEPSTVFAALGLAGLMLWSARRRLTALIRQK